MNIAARGRHVCKQLLGHSFELEVEQRLRAEDQEARLVERRLQFRVDLHQKMNLWLHTEFQSRRRAIASSRENDMAKTAKKRTYGKGAAKKVRRAMEKRKAGTLRSGRSGKKVKSRKQAIAIGLSEARKRGAKVPRKKKSS